MFFVDPIEEVSSDSSVKNCFRYAILEKAIYESQSTGTRMLTLSKCKFPGTEGELLVELKRLFDGHIHIGKVPIDPLSLCYGPSYAGYTEVHGTKKDDPNEMAWMIAVKLVRES